MGGWLWASLADEGSLVALEVPCGTERRRVRGLSSPGRIAAGGGRIFALDTGDGTLAAFSLQGERLYGVAAAPGPMSLCLSEDATRVYVGGGDSESVSMFDARDGALLASVRLAGEPRWLDVRGQTLLAACSGALYRLDAPTLSVFDARALPLCGAVFVRDGVAAALAYDEMRGGRLCVLDGSRRGEWALPSAPVALRRGDDLLLAMDNAVASIRLSPFSFCLTPFDGWPDDILCVPEGGIFAADAASRAIWRLEGGGKTAFYRGGRPVALAFQPGASSGRVSASSVRP